MKKTQGVKLYPFEKGLDLESTVGTRDVRSLEESKNLIIKNRSSLKKAPGVTAIPYSGEKDGVQAATHFFGTSGGAQIDEIVQVRKGRVEVIRDGKTIDLGQSVSPTDSVVFERFNNVLIIHFENTPPKTYTIRGTSLSDLGILSSHEDIPPTFSRRHHFRLWYGGRPNFPHRLTVSAIDDISNFQLVNGAFQMRINEGDSDLIGLTGLSNTFRGDLFAYKYNSIYRIYLDRYGYAIDTVTEEVGCVHHNTIQTTQNDVFHVSSDGIHSLVNTDKYGAVEEATISYPIYEWFQENVNWSLSKYMVATYDKSSNTYLLSYASSGSSVNNRILGFNTISKEFFIWEDIEYPTIGKYYDLGRQKTMVGDFEKGLGILDSSINTRFGDPINIRFVTNLSFPTQNLKNKVNFTNAWIFCKPTEKSVKYSFSYWVDGDLIDTVTLDTYGSGFGAKIGSSIIGSGKIGKNKDRVVINPVTLSGEGSAIQFEITQEPPDDDYDQPFECFGIIYEFDDFEDSEKTTQI